MTKQHARSLDPDVLERRLHREHEGFAERFREIAERAQTGDSREVDEVWDGFAADLRRHMAFEERLLFDAFVREGPGNAATVRQLRTDHDDIRRTLDQLGIEIQLHIVRAETIDAFLERLIAHSKRENEVFYPWLESRSA